MRSFRQSLSSTYTRIQKSNRGSRMEKHVNELLPGKNQDVLVELGNRPWLNMVYVAQYIFCDIYYGGPEARSPIVYVAKDELIVRLAVVPSLYRYLTEN